MKRRSPFRCFRCALVGLVFIGSTALVAAENSAPTVAASTPLLLDWAFWAAIVAAVAVVLSQIPPVLTLIRSAKIECELYSRLYVTHMVGNPSVQLHVILRNVGGRSVRLGGIQLRVKRDGKEITTLPAQNYQTDPSDSKKTVLFTRVQLNADQEWAYIVNFFNYFSRTEDNAFRSADAALKENIWKKRTQPGYPDRIVEADPSLVVPFQTMFDEMFIWLPGEYEIQLSVQDAVGNMVKEKHFSFTLFEADSNELVKMREGYKTGDCIHWYSGRFNGVGVPIRVDPK